MRRALSIAAPGAKARTKLAEKLAASEASAADLAQQADDAKIRAEQQAAAAEAASAELAETAKKLVASEALAADLAKQVDDAKRDKAAAAEAAAEAAAAAAETAKKLAAPEAAPADLEAKQLIDTDLEAGTVRRSMGLPKRAASDGGGPYQQLIDGEQGDSRYLPRMTKGFFAAVLTTNTCCTAFLCIILVVLYQHSYASGVGEVQPRPPPPPISSYDYDYDVAPPPPTSSCAIYHAGAAVFEGAMHTMTADGLTEVETEEGEIVTEERTGFSNTFAPTFFDFECLLANGTGDPCDAYVAEAFADQMFVPLRTDSLVGLWLSTIFLYSLAQIGGIPRPRFVDRRIDWPGTVFWLSWMLTQLCQFLVVGLSLAMQVVAFFGVHERTGPCMVRVDNFTLLDEYATVTFAAQPALLSKLLLLVVYGYLLSLGALVFIGRKVNEVEFKEEASKTNTSLVQPIPLASVLYFISRWALYGICLGTVGGWLGWPGASWAAALVAAAVGSLTGGFRRGKDSLSRATVAKCALGVLLALPILPNLVYLPLGGLFLGFVNLIFAAGRTSLDLIESTATSEWRCFQRLEALTKAAAAATKPAISWLAPLGSLELSSGMSMVVQGLAYTETSLSTLAGGLACVLGCLALSPLVAYGTWAAEQGRLEPDYDVEDSVVDVVQARLWMLWVLVAMPVLLFAVEFCMDGKLLADRCEEGGIYLSLTSEPVTNVLLTIYVIPFFLALGFAILFASLDDSYIERVIWHAQVVYGDSFAFLATLQLDVSGLQPFLDSVMADMVAFTGDPLGAAQKVADRLAEIVTDPLAPVREVVEVVANMSRYLEIDPSYFVEHSAALDVLNVSLGLLKLLATYGRKAFALYDAVLRLFRGEKGEGNEEDDGVVQVHECVADPKKAQLEADMELLCQRGVYSEGKTSLDLRRTRLAAGDGATIALWLKDNGVLKTLSISRNDIGPEGGVAIAEALRGNGVLTNLVLLNNSIADEGAAALASALRVNGVLTSLDVGSNGLTEEAALSIVRVERQRNKLTSLGLASCSIGPTGAAEIAEYVSGSGVLKNLDLRDNEIGDEGAKAIGGALAVNEVLTTLVLSGSEFSPGGIGDEGYMLAYNGIGIDGAKALASALRVNAVLTNLDLGWNEIGDEGVEALASALRVNGVLKTLDLSFNDTGPESGVAIGKALAVNGVLTDLNLSGNNIGGGTGWIKASEVEGESKEVGAKVIYQGREMVVSVGVDSDGELQLQDPTGVIAIAKALEVNGVLTTLNLRQNDIGNEGAAALASALRVNGVLKNIDLNYNNLGDEGEKAIHDAVSGREGFELKM